MIVVLMGPSGCGKSTIGAALSAMLGWPFIEGDSHHSKANKAKQAAGSSLTDDDRKGWIDAIVSDANARDDTHLLLACSALTPYVQTRLQAEIKRRIEWVLLEVSTADLRARLEARTNHFMPVDLLDDQLAALTRPDGVIGIDASQPVETVCQNIEAALNKKA